MAVSRFNPDYPDAGLVLLNSTTFTGASTVSVDNVFSSTYDNYRIVINNLIGTSASVTLSAQLRNSGSNDSNNAYRYGRYVVGAGASQVATNQNNSGTTSWVLMYLNNTNKNASVIDLFNPFSNVQTIGVEISSGNFFDMFGLIFTNTTSFDGFTIYPNTGTISGTVRVYGYKNEV